MCVCVCVGGFVSYVVLTTIIIVLLLLLQGRVAGLAEAWCF